MWRHSPAILYRADRKTHLWFPANLFPPLSTTQQLPPYSLFLPHNMCPSFTLLLLCWISQRLLVYNSSIKSLELQDPGERCPGVWEREVQRKKKLEDDKDTRPQGPANRSAFLKYGVENLGRRMEHVFFLGFYFIWLQLGSWCISTDKKKKNPDATFASHFPL